MFIVHHIRDLSTYLTFKHIIQITRRHRKYKAYEVYWKKNLIPKEYSFWKNNATYNRLSKIHTETLSTYNNKLHMGLINLDILKAYDPTLKLLILKNLNKILSTNQMHDFFLATFSIQEHFKSELTIIFQTRANRQMESLKDQHFLRHDSL